MKSCLFIGHRDASEEQLLTMKKIVARIIAPWDVVAEWAHDCEGISWSNLGWKVHSVGCKVLNRLTHNDSGEYLRLIDEAWDKIKIKYEKGR